LVRSAADILPEHYREVWRLCDVETMSGEEAAEAMGITPALVRVRLHRARGLILDRLRKERPGLFRKITEAGSSRQFPGRRGYEDRKLPPLRPRLAGPDNREPGDAPAAVDRRGGPRRAPAGSAGRIAGGSGVRRHWFPPGIGLPALCRPRNLRPPAPSSTSSSGARE
jgi:hypothetical protein